MNYTRSNHNRDVYAEILALHRDRSLTPFVGAGLSVFCGYKLWPSVLAELSEYIEEPREKKKAQSLIKGGKLLEAAQHIQDAYNPMFSRLTRIVNYQKITDCPPERMWASADWVLPYLFGSVPVMTTNFDRVLEYVFSQNGAGFERSLDPYDPDLLTQMRQKKSHGLFKLHGDIGEKTTSIDRLVFTQGQYDDVYSGEGKLVGELKQWYENQTLLFLGSSLSMDKTMEVLQGVKSRNAGVKHYAIIDCPRKNLGKRINELSALGIEAIFYDGNNHDAVRVILERLLEETDPEGFKRLYASRPPAPPRKAKDRPMMYDAGYIPFTGRQAEWEKLDAFCACDADTPLWWAVTGPGGMGKSRLVYEFTNSKRTQGWDVQWFSQRELPKLGGYIPGVQPTIVVLDDVQAYMQTVGQWMEEMEKHPRSEKLRILLLEREGVDMGSATWLRTMQNGSPYHDPLRDWCHDENFLNLKPMDDGHLKAIIRDYAAASEKSLDADRLLKTLENVDPGLKRPLYALAIADAQCKGNNPTNWSANRVLDTLLTRELEFHIERLLGLIPGLKVRGSLQGEFEHLLARSCVRGFLPVEDVPAARYPKLHTLMEEERMDPFEFYEAIGIGHNAIFRSYTTDANGNIIDEHPEEEKQIIALDCPDLIKEHLVLQQALDRRSLDLLLPDGWENDPGQLVYLRHLLAGYPERLKEQTVYWDTFLKASPKAGLPAWIYADILLGITAVLPSLGEKAVERVAELYVESKQELQIAISYARAMVNQAIDKPLDHIQHTVDQLKCLLDSHSDCIDIVIPYARGLYLLAEGQELKDCIKTVDILKQLYNSHSDNQEVAIWYATGLCKLTLDQTAVENRKTVETLKYLHTSHPDCQDIASVYAAAIGSIGIALSLEEFIEVVNTLQQLYNAYPMDEIIATVYSGRMVGLALQQNTEEEIRSTLARSESVLNQQPANEDVQLAYAETWFNLTLKQSADDIPGTVAEIAAFLRKHSAIISDFKRDLDTYLSEHPEHTARYQVLKDL